VITQTDQMLITKLSLSGQAEVFGIIVERYQKQIRRTLFRLTRGNESLVDDLAQETFLQAFKKINTFSGNGHLGGWLSKIAYNCFLQHIRRNKGHDQLSTDIADEKSVGTTAQSLMRMDIEKAMLQLSMAERIAIDLCLANGFSHGEAADIMDMPLGTVKSHVLRGKAKLKKIIEEGDQA
jgi:RNA polymerase sigma-70 factor, ECF subfamily